MTRRVAIDLRFVEVEYELWALEHTLSQIEPAIAYLSQVEEHKTLAELRESGWDHDEAEVDLAFQDIREKREYVLPRLMRGPFVVALWASYEAGITAIAAYRAEGLGAPPLRLGHSPLKCARSHFSEHLGLMLDPDDKRYARLHALYYVRNAFAHANGLKPGMSVGLWDRLLQSKESRALVDKNREMVIPTHGYVVRAHADVSGSLQSLVRRARSADRTRHRAQRP